MKKLLVFQHIPREHPSNIANYTRDRGITLDIVELWRKAAMPLPSAYDALVVLGGSMGVYEDYPNKREELSALSKAIGTVPILGVCLGAQLLAHSLGASVYPHKKGGKHVKEIGHYEVMKTPEGERGPLFQGFSSPFTVLQWHGDTFDVPEGAKLLATGSLCTNQAFSYGNAYGLQFHVEATPEIVSTWLKDDAAWTHADFDMKEERVREEAEKLAPVMKAQCYRLMDNFLGV